MQHQGKQKTDGYIKNQKIRLKEMRLNILLKFFCQNQDIRKIEKRRILWEIKENGKSRSNIDVRR